MATKLIKFGQQLYAGNLSQRLHRTLIIESPTALTACQFPEGSIVRNLSLSSCLKKTDNQDAKPKDPARDRTVLIPYETSIRYLESKAFKKAYGDKPVWFHYRRNHKGALPSRRTRPNCMFRGFITTGNPCPICRDEYLVLHYKNVALLKQFISEISGEILPIKKTNLCQHQNENLLIEIQKAKDFGTISFDLPFRVYDYKEYIPEGLHFHETS